MSSASPSSSMGSDWASRLRHAAAAAGRFVTSARAAAGRFLDGIPGGALERQRPRARQKPETEWLRIGVSVSGLCVSGEGRR
eukprot:2571514-Pyramimonas_sp.AAC.1